MDKIRVQTGGKLYIAGEYAILTPGQTALLKNIPIYMTADIEAAESIRLQSDMFDYSVGMAFDKGYHLIQASIQTWADFLEMPLEQLRPFFLSISGKLERDGKKLGIGSSGSVTVLTLKALSAFYQIEVSKDTLFKLASYTLLKLGDNGSMGDIATISYDALIAYKSFNRQQVCSWIDQFSLQTILKRDWGYEIEEIHSKISYDFLVGWTRHPAISRDMINHVKASITERFLSDTEAAVQVCKEALLHGDKQTFKEALETVSSLLEQLHPAIYIPHLKALKKAQENLDVIAKSSGSGGGDCGIAFSFDRDDTQTIIARWQNEGIALLELETYYG